MELNTDPCQKTDKTVPPQEHEKQGVDCQRSKKKTTYAEATKKPKNLPAPIAGEYKRQTQTRRDIHNPRPTRNRELVLANGNSKIPETLAKTQAEEHLKNWNRLQTRLMKIADKKNAAIQLSNKFQVLASVHPHKETGNQVRKKTKEETPTSLQIQQLETPAGFRARKKAKKIAKPESGKTTSIRRRRILHGQDENSRTPTSSNP